jgi:hypothetical protein
MYTTATTSTTPTITGTSRLVTAESAVRPRPGRAKICSTTTAPEMRKPNAQPESAIPGAAACRSACRSRTPASDSPRARAASAKGESSASSSASRMIWPRKPASGIASVSTGSTRPAGEDPLTAGSQPRPVEKTRISTTPIQKCGSDAATISTPAPTAAATRPAPVETKASRSARIQATASARTASSSVPGSCRASTATTSSRSAYERPRSPCASRPSCARYCTRSGWSRPYSARTAATASGGACEPGPPRIACAGSPGMSRTARNVTVATAHSTRTAPPIRAPTARRSAGRREPDADRARPRVTGLARCRTASGSRPTAGRGGPARLWRAGSGSAGRRAAGSSTRP